MVASRGGVPVTLDRGRTAHSPDFDVIVIGSGIGGMSCASLLASLRGLRVAVLERHFRLGGYAQQFTRPGGLRWDTGLHYVGGMEAGSAQRSLLDAVTGDSIEWRQLPSPFEHYTFPGLTVSQPAGARAWREVLASRWPAETIALDRYFAQLEVAAEWFMARTTIDQTARSSRASAPLPSRASAALPSRASAALPSRASAALPSRASAALPLATTRSVLDACGLQSPELRAVLTAQWGNYGVPPGRSAFAAHALVAQHFMDGGWYPRGGGDAVVRGARAVIEAAGGVCMVRHDVRRIVLERGRAIGVVVESGPQSARRTETLTAAAVISDAGAATTYWHLLRDDGGVCAAQREHIVSLDDGGTALQLFLGLDASPAALGQTGANQWLFTGLDLDALCAERDRVATGAAPAAFVSFPSLNDTSQPNHTAIIVAPVSRSLFAPWAGLSWKRRGPDYEGLKQTICESLLRLVEQRIPGFRDLVTYAELATPLTFEHFTGHGGGAIYGMPAVPQRFVGPAAPGPLTPVPGLLLAGSDAFASGITGAAVGGALAAGQLLGPGGVGRLLAAVHQRGAARTRPAAADFSASAAAPRHSGG
jgi:all-trans-retinol 13,14-reductase